MAQHPPPIIATLIARFDQNSASYRSATYNEAQVRQEFINPFLEALGWDVANTSGHAEAYKDVIHEDAIKVGAPDYCFRIGGARKFFLEAKKPAVNIKEDPDPAYQLRRYAWSAKLPLSILTDFEEFAVYDCRARPSPSDKASAGRIHYLTYKDYATRWDEIASVFSKDAVLKGSFDKYAVSERKRGTTTVDAEFLAEIEKWREDLAKNLAVRNQALDVHELNFAVQRTIDRLIFLRICEDRGIEPSAQLQSLLNGENIYARLRHLYDQADDRYNSGLFHFRSEKERAETPDALTPTLKIDDKVLKDIIRGLYYPESPYEFSVMPAEILGQVYEQFLGKVIRLTAGHQAKVEEKPEVKKAGGVYYTPAYIVEYIVRNTVGKLCEGKTPKQIAGVGARHASPLRILDPACGSGSFLIGAYDYLVAYHRDWYLKDGAEKHRKELYQGAGGLWHLTTQEKKRILLNNIYGVDIDSQAVEVTKLSLLLKVLEGENEETLKKQLKMWHERALPDLGRNIKWGNSLIGPDYFTGQLLPDEDEMRRVNPFDWNAEFSEIMKAGGFDAVIGNPPYVRIQTMKEWAPLEVEAYKGLFESASKGNYDIYVVFVEKGLGLLNKTGRLGFILPHKFFQAQYGEPLRSLLAKGKHLANVIHFGDQQVFEGATTYTCLLFLDKAGCDGCRVVKVDDLAAWRTTGAATQGTVPAKNITSAEWNFAVGKGAALFEKLSKMPVKLGDVADRMAQGIRTSANEVYVLDVVSSTGDLLKARSKQLGRVVDVERKSVLMFLQGREIKPFSIQPSGKVVLFPYRISERQSELIAEKEMRQRFPKALEYLHANQAHLRNREDGRWDGPQWYAYGRQQNIDLMPIPKILVPDIADRASFALDETGKYAFTSGYGITLKREIRESPKYFLGLFNSKLLDFYLKRVSTVMRGGFFRYFTQFIEQLPIRPINFSDKADKTKHDQMVSLVERMLDLHKRLPKAKAPDDKTKLQRQVDATDREIDRLVYDLYGLTEEELGIVEACGEPGRTRTAVASGGTECENTSHENADPSSHRPRRGGRQTMPVAKASRHAGESGGGAPQGASGSSGPVHGVRERTGEYGPPEDPAERAEGEAGRLGSTRYFETAEGTLSYTQVSERLAVSLAGILQEILQTAPEQITITPEWLCLRHQTLAGHLFPEWAGRFRDVNVQVGSHTPPPFYKVPVLIRLFCDDLAERFRRTRLRESEVGAIAELLAWADGRFQGIHPFKDFNGRIGRVLLAAVLYKLALPHVETAPLDAEARRLYLHALQAADNGDLGPLTDIWTHRIAETL